MKLYTATLLALLIGVPTAYAAPETNPPAEPKATETASCIDIKASLQAGMGISEILTKLIEPTCCMALQTAVDAIVAAGGDKAATLQASLQVNQDNLCNLPGTAAGGAGNSINFTPKGSTGGGGRPVSP